jgi:[ribosomal protein S5]-alanine N-acetyltransferase
MHTARLRVREFVAADFAALFALSSDPRVTRYMFFGPRDELQTRDYLHDILSAQRQTPRERFELAVESRQLGHIIGACDLTLIERGVADMGYMFAHDAWGQGHATELVLALIDTAFYDLKADQVIATVDIANAASLRVLEKTGLRWEATYRKFRRAKNRWWDCHLYSLPRTVWESNHSVGTLPSGNRIKPS